MSPIKELSSLIGACRSAAPAATLVLGGSAFSIAPEELLLELDVGIGVWGEAENTFPRLIACLETGQDFSALPGVVTMEGGRTRLNPPQRLSGKPMELASPSLNLIDVGKYVELGGSGSVQSRRGCAFTCSYCSYPILEGKQLRRSDAEMVADKVEEMLEAGFRHFWFVDSVFTVPKRYAISEVVPENRTGG